MVQKPRLNVVNSSIACVVALVANFFLILNWGVLGAAFGILLPYVLLGILRHRALHSVFHWRNPWSQIGPPFFAALGAALPAVVCRATIDGIPGEIVSSLVFLLVYLLAWLYYRRFVMTHSPI
jgi:O-antigen/teichoic acid export membrane protein